MKNIYELDKLVPKPDRSAVMRAMDCYEDHPLYEEIVEEYEEICGRMFSLAKPVGILGFGTLPETIETEKYKAGAPVIYAVLSIGDGIRQCSTDAFREGDYVKGMLCDAIADNLLFSLEGPMLEKLREVCAEHKMGILARLEAPHDISMESQYTAWEYLELERRFGIGISSGFMFDPVKTSCQIFVLTEDENVFKANHDCRKCPNIHCKMRNIPKTEGEEKMKTMESKYAEYQIENEYLRVVVSEKGGELKSVYDKKEQRELLWQGDDRYWGDSAPNLFPYIARLTEGRYIYQGKSYQMKIHGFVMYSVLKCTEAEHGLSFELRANDNTRAEYPFEFVYRVNYQLAGSAIKITYEVENRDTKKMYFGIGGHPGFQVPFVEGTKFEDYYLEFAEDAEPLKVRFSEDCFVLGKEEFRGLANGKLPLRHSLFDEDAIVLENTKSRVALKCEKSPASICVEYDDMRYIGFWHCPRTEAPYVCIEPWSSLPSRKGIVEDLEKQEDLLELLPGETYTGIVCISVS